MDPCSGLARSGEAQALAHTLIQLGKALGLETLAEGVEDRAQALALQGEGCDLVQGYLFARPLAVDALEEFLKEDLALGDAGETRNGNAQRTHSVQMRS